MFKLSFTKKDIVRAVWTFVIASVTFIGANAANLQGLKGLSAWEAFGASAVMAGLSALKNLVLQDGTVLKG